MLEFADVILLGREEPASEDNRWVRERYEALTAEMAGPYLREHTDRPELWHGHNVFAAIGPFGRWYRYEWQTWEGLGTLPIPHLAGVVRHDLTLGVIYPLAVDPVDPPVLHRSYELLPPPLPRRPDSREKILVACRKLERLGLLDWPEANSKLGWEAILRRQGLRILYGAVVAVEVKDACVPRPAA